MKPHERLVVFKKADAYTVAVLELVERLTASRRWAIADQLSRSALSVTLNIVEGWSRGSKAETKRFFNYSSGSLEETQYLLTVLRRCPRYGVPSVAIDPIYALGEHVGALQTAFVRTIKRR